MIRLNRHTNCKAKAALINGACTEPSISFNETLLLRLRRSTGQIKPLGTNDETNRSALSIREHTMEQIIKADEPLVFQSLIAHDVWLEEFSQYSSQLSSTVI